MTKFHFAGRYNGDPDSLITHEHEPGHVRFKEIEDMNRLALAANGISVIIPAITLGLYFIIGRQRLSIAGTILTLIAMVPHEFLHAVCFEGDVYMYENLRKGLLFVTGPGTFSKIGFVFMSLLPNIVFGLIPFIIFLIDPSQSVFGTLGAFSLAAGAGDYYNIWNALTQMPKGSRTYLHGMHSYWYKPAEKH